MSKKQKRENPLDFYSPIEGYEKNVFETIANSIANVVSEKNKRYGNSVLQPLSIFKGKCQAGDRLDDKLSRIKNSSILRKNDVADLMGYLMLTCKENGWTDFSDQID